MTRVLLVALTALALAGLAPSVAHAEPGVRPGKKVVSRVSETDAGVYSRRECRPAKVDGFRVYIPNETESQYIPHPTTGCRSHRVHLMTHKAYRLPR